jgi:lipopolysaccharide heptosyltransferase II
VVLTTPLIAHLARQGAVDVVATPRGAALLANNPHIRRLIAYDKRGADRGLGGLLTAVRAAATDEKSNIAYCAQGSVRTALLALASGYRSRVGFDTSAGRWWYTRRVPVRADRHHAERLLRLAVGDDAAVAPDALRPRLYPGASDLKAVDDLLGAAGHRGEPLVALAPGSVWATKRWPYYAELARGFVGMARVAVIGAGEDADLARAIYDATAGTAIDAAGKLSLLASTALLERCALLITNDSAPQHLASAAGTPTLSIFGPTVPEFGFGPLAAASRVVGHTGLSCRPCHAHGPPACPLGHWRCMRELDAAQIHEVAMAMLEPTTV